MFAAENRALCRGNSVFESLGTNGFIFGVFCVFSPKGKQKQMKIQPKPNQNTSLPLTRTSSSVSSHGEEKFSKCINLSKQIKAYIHENPAIERAGSKVVEMCCL